MAKTTEITAASSSNIVEQRINEPKYKGARKRKWGKYVSEIRLPNSRKRIWLGSYDTAEKAARAFDAALFCLRGPNAKFNFPDDPSKIGGGRRLTPAEIQAVAQHHANSYSCSWNNQPQPANSGNIAKSGSRAVELEDTSPSSNSEEAGPMDSIDWSFLDVLDKNVGGNSAHVPDFGLFHEPGDLYMPPDIADKGNEDEENDDNGNGGNVPSFVLWNF